MPDQSEVLFEDPPEKPMYNWVRIAQRLRDNPMKWGKVFEFDRTSVANAIRQGSIRAVHPSLGFEVQTSNNQRSPRRCTLYLRYNPEKENTLQAAIQRSREQE